MSTTSSSSTTNRPWTVASSAPGRTTDGSARSPASSPMAPTSIVFPAPVSPGEGGHAGVEDEGDALDHAEVADGELSEHEAARPGWNRRREGVGGRLVDMGGAGGREAAPAAGGARSRSSASVSADPCRRKPHAVVAAATGPPARTSTSGSAGSRVARR